ncbi:MAG: hypothetical protein ACOCUW_03855, partial [Gemmatimonadota bacterium]
MIDFAPSFRNAVCGPLRDPGAGVLNQAFLMMDVERARANRAAGATLHYQPIRSVADGRVVGAEALLRWERSGAVIP